MGSKENKRAVHYFINQADEEAARRHFLEKLQRQQIERSTRAYTRAQILLQEYGIEKETWEGTGAGRGIIGYSLESVKHSETLPVPIENDPKGGKVYLKEMISSRPGYRFGQDSLDLIYEDSEGVLTRLVVIKNGEVFNSSEKEISLGEFLTLDKVFDFLASEYKKKGKEIDEQRKVKAHSSLYTDLCKFPLL